MYFVSNYKSLSHRALPGQFMDNSAVPQTLGPLYPPVPFSFSSSTQHYLIPHMLVYFTVRYLPPFWNVSSMKVRVLCVLFSPGAPAPGS